MAFLVAVLCLIYMSWGLSLIINKRFEITFAPTIFIIIFILYCFGLIDALKFGVYVTYFLTIMAAAFCVYKIWNSPNKVSLKEIDVFELLFPPSFFVLLIISAFIWYGARDQKLSLWDEFSHWGLVVKNMAVLDSFGSVPQATTLFKGYPPGMSLFEYWIVKFQGQYMEHNVMMASGLFVTAMLLPIMKNVGSKDYLKSILLGVLIYLLPFSYFFLFAPYFFYSSPYISIYIDFPMGLIYAYILYAYYSEIEKNYLTFINIGLASFVLVLTKPAGMGIALIALAIIFCDLIRIMRSGKNRKMVLGQFSIAALFLAFGKITWNFHLKTVEINEAWINRGGSFTFKGLYDLFTQKAPAYKYTVIDNFIGNFWKFNDFGYIKISFLLYTVIIMVIAAIIYYYASDKRDKSKVLIFSWGIIIGFLVYSISVLVLYVFTFLEFEALILASCDRYILTYISGAVIFLLFMLITETSRNKSKLAANIVILLTIIFSILTIPVENTFNQAFLPNIKIEEKNQYRMKFNMGNDFPEFMDANKDRVFVIEQNEYGEGWYQIKYNATPIQVSPLNTWSLGEKYDDEDEWTSNISPSEWEEMLRKDYTFVYIIVFDERFESEYGFLFADKLENRTLYQVDKSGEQIVLRKFNR